MTDRIARALTLALLCALGLTACGDDSSAGTSGPSPPKQDRIVAVRFFQDGLPTIAGENARSAGDAIASLRPTWVSSLIRFSSTANVGADEISAWNTIREIVRKQVPDAQFDLELNALEYKTADDVISMMRELRGKFDNEGWFFDFYTPAYAKNPAVVKAAISEAHENGEWIGGNAFGLSKDPKVPPGSDFIAVQDFGFEIDLAAVRALARQVPTAFHLGNSPGQARSDGCRFINELTTTERVAYVSKRAKQQAANDYRFAYPLFFPECDAPGGPASYNALEDPPMTKTLKQLLGKYD